MAVCLCVGISSHFFVSHVFRFFVAWRGVITMAATNRNYGLKKKLQLFIDFSFILFEWFKKFWAQKHTPPHPQPTHQPTNQPVKMCQLYNDWWL